MDRPSLHGGGAALEEALPACARGAGAEALFLLTLRLAEEGGWLERGSCARALAVAAGARASALRALGLALRAASGRALPAAVPGEAELRAALEAGLDAAPLLAGPAPEVEDLCAVYEAGAALALAHGRRAAGVYYTPPAIAAHLVSLALAHGAVRPQAGLRVVDPCAGAGALLVAAGRALPGGVRAVRWEGSDLDPAALRVCRAALLLLAGPAARQHPPALRALDALRRAPGPPADLLVTNPPYGHLDAPAERAFLAARLPALRGGEVDRYAAFLLRSLELVRPGGTCALLVPDTWMTNARAGALREAVLARGELAAVADLGKPFAAAKDTRVQAVVLVRRGAASRAASARAFRLAGGRLLPLLPLPPEALAREARAGWRPYRSRAEQRLCEAAERAALPLGSVCEVGYGLRTGDNPRFVGRGAGPAGAVALCGGEDVVPYALCPRPKFLQAPTPALLALAARQLGRPRLAVQRIRTNSAAPWARWLEAAPVPAPLVCLDSLSTLATPDEELYWALLGLLGSVALDRVHRLRTTDVNVKPSALRELPVPRALLDPAARRPLVLLVRERARRAQAAPAEPRRRPRAPAAVPALDRAIDRAIYSLYDLAPAEVEASERGYWGDRFDEEFPRLEEPHGAPVAGDVGPPG